MHNARLILLVGGALGFLSCGPGKTTDPPIKPDYLTGSVVGLPDDVPTQTLNLADGDTVRMTVEFVKKSLGGQPLRMLAYNRSIPGPIIKVKQNASIVLLLTNNTGLPTTLHSHGIRSDSKYDGMEGLSQVAIDSGKSFSYILKFPDPGVFWYHPHVRESYGQELGLYGNFLVEPTDSSYWSPVHREEMLVIDDLWVEKGVIRPFYKKKIDFAMMGRYGNLSLVNGKEVPTMTVKRGEVIRFYATNVSGARIYNLRLSDNSLLNVVGADNGRSEFSRNLYSHIIAPSERLIFQVGFNYKGKDTVLLESVGVGRFVDPAEPKRLLMRFVYSTESVTTDLSSSLVASQSLSVKKDIDQYRPYFKKAPDQSILLTGYMIMGAPSIPPSSRSAPAQYDSNLIDNMDIEWYDNMFNMNVISDTGNMKLTIRDMKTGLENHMINWVFSYKKGDLNPIIIHIQNDTSTASSAGRMTHVMPHPIHFHGQRFLVLNEGPPGDIRENTTDLVWKDTYLVGSRFSVDILLDASNPGQWMFHCHIPEHLESDMMGHFSVVQTGPGALIKGTGNQ